MTIISYALNRRGKKHHTRGSASCLRPCDHVQTRSWIVFAQMSLKDSNVISYPNFFIFYFLLFGLSHYSEFRLSDGLTCDSKPKCDEQRNNYYELHFIPSRHTVKWFVDQSMALSCFGFILICTWAVHRPVQCVLFRFKPQTLRAQRKHPSWWKGWRIIFKCVCLILPNECSGCATEIEWKLDTRKVWPFVVICVSWWCSRFCRRNVCRIKVRLLQA